ncbi:MAG: hypothetical protein KME60_11470 [Cyanomargarita calcarea GSE-NOS-MK-12-04C]|uniref:Uncharacterized protein n=1 Tax=Cyanomargarita calcarea GSE-NOS-MK-12-04C TaxID=2839659 RepID=A0A951QN23_9CYAN|nr:hypothetical protein [Cyanomargarita calcarea GSE-NOS-MK-12-04C]
MTHFYNIIAIALIRNRLIAKVFIARTTPQYCSDKDDCRLGGGFAKPNKAL